jgi:ankyrin repeat protein
VAAFLFEHGADPNWIGWDDLAALDVAERAEAADVVEWLRSVGAKPAAELGS